LIDSDAGNRSLSELRADLVRAQRLRQDADRANRLAKIDEAIGPVVKKIGAIIENTTAVGRENPEIGDGSSEAAAKYEAKTGKRVKDKAHGPKCRMESAGLAGEIAKLKDLRTQTGDKAVLDRIDAAVRRGEERKKGLDSGAAAWKSRRAAYPSVWDQATGDSVVEPGFGKGDI
jgi:hypothetical protein